MKLFRSYQREKQKHILAIAINGLHYINDNLNASNRSAQLSLYQILLFFQYMVTARIQTYTIAIIPAILFELGVLTSASMTTTADGQAAVDKEKINRQLEQAVKALDSGDIAASEEYLYKIIQKLPTGEAKTHLASLSSLNS